MLTKLVLKNFKQFTEVEIELGNPVVFVGPNNSGKTTALQALALWDIGLRRWNEKRHGKASPQKRPGVTINRKDLIAIPVPEARLLWRDLHVRDVRRASGSSQETRNVRIDIVVEGVTDDKEWKCGLEFDYANEESFYCRPMRLTESKDAERMPIPEEASRIRLAFLPPMSGLAANETKLDPGAINLRIGEGRTAEVLRNLCYQILTGPEGQNAWRELTGRIQSLFGVTINEPVYIPERGEIQMEYQTRGGIQLDLSCSGRGLQQTLLVLAHLQVNPQSVLLLDEPDAHLEILRQREIYQVLCSSAGKSGSQVIAASHSEIILEEAAGRDVVVAFVGKPHRIDSRSSQLLKSLKEIGYEDYFQSEQTGWVLYLEGSTDLEILRGFAERLGHPAGEVLQRPFVKYVQQPQKARDHFYGLQEAKPDLRGMVLLDRQDRELLTGNLLREYAWKRREIGNYLCQPETLYAYAKEHDAKEHGPLFARQEFEKRQDAMQKSIEENTIPAALKDRNHSFWRDTKASDDYLDPISKSYLRLLDLPPDLLKKNNYHQLAVYVPNELIDPEVSHVLDLILETSRQAQPRLE